MGHRSNLHSDIVLKIVNKTLWTWMRNSTRFGTCVTYPTMNPIQPSNNINFQEFITFGGPDVQRVTLQEVIVSEYTFEGGMRTYMFWTIWFPEKRGILNGSYTGGWVKGWSKRTFPQHGNLVDSLFYVTAVLQRLLDTGERGHLSSRYIVISL